MAGSAGRRPTAVVKSRQIGTETGKSVSSPTDHVIEGRRGVGGTFTVLGLIKMAALVVHTAALELTEQVEEAVFIGGVTAQLLHGGWQTGVTETAHLNVCMKPNTEFLKPSNKISLIKVDASKTWMRIFQTCSLWMGNIISLSHEKARTTLAHFLKVVQSILKVQLQYTHTYHYMIIVNSFNLTLPHFSHIERDYL